MGELGLQLLEHGGEDGNGVLLCERQSLTIAPTKPMSMIVCHSCVSRIERISFLFSSDAELTACASRFACCLPPADRIDLQRLLPHAPAASSTAHAAECPPSAARWSAVQPSSSCASFAHSAAACRQLCSRSVSPSAAARRRLTAALSAGADTVYTAPHWSGWQSAEMGCTCTDTLAAAGSGFGRSACAASAVARRSCPRRRVAARREAREDIAQHTTAAHQGPAGVASVCIC